MDGPDVAHYAIAHSTSPDDIGRRLIAETTERLGPRAGMQILPRRGSLPAPIAGASGPRYAVEVGTSPVLRLCIARALPPDGTFVL